MIFGPLLQVNYKYFQRLSLIGECLVKPDRSRYIWLYLPSKADKDRWKALAEKAKTPLSTFCISIIEEKLAEEDDLKPRSQVARELDDLKRRE